MITILTGTNSFLLKRELKRLVDAFVTEHTDIAGLGVERLDGEEASFEQMQEALQSLPFLASRKMVVLRSPGSNKQFTEKAEMLLKELPDTTDLIIVEPKLDKRSSYYKFLKKQKGFQEFGDLDERGLANWLVNAAKERGASLSIGDASYLISRAGTNQQALSGEIEKLALHTDTIDRKTIEALVPATPQSTIFQLLEAAFAGNTKRVLELYGEQRALKVEPQQIIAMLAWQLHVLALVKTAKDKTPDEIAREAKISPYVVRKSDGLARRLSGADTRRLVADLLEIDQRLKREALNADDALLNYFITITK
ncbi:MAG TPA: DNA polymerase III subunit delta [Candidatus Saccharimonadales bacterium]|nr:DNA polymerase III subunit delta [Candidatus Saccharimonadales bacterium]